MLLTCPMGINIVWLGFTDLRRHFAQIITNTSLHTLQPWLQILDFSSGSAWVTSMLGLKKIEKQHLPRLCLGFLCPSSMYHQRKLTNQTISSERAIICNTYTHLKWNRRVIVNWNFPYMIKSLLPVKKLQRKSGILVHFPKDQTEWTVNLLCQARVGVILADFPVKSRHSTATYDSNAGNWLTQI